MKRIIDILGSLAGLLLLSPVMLILWLLIRIKLGKPAIFHQRRIGYHGKVFELVKFRSMTEAKDAEGNYLPDIDRLTDFGKWIRSSSLDELPELWNVLRGDMSFVGPRPLMEELRSKHTEEQFHRHDVMPGITGWAQINGRNGISWEDRFVLDLWYVKNRSLKIDLKILIKTFIDVFNSEGINSSFGTGIQYTEEKILTVNTQIVERNFRVFFHSCWHFFMRCATDMILIVFSLFLAYQIGFFFHYYGYHVKQAAFFWRHAGLLILFIFGTLLITGTYKHLWRRFGLSDILRYIGCFSLSSVFAFCWRFFGDNTFPKAIPLRALSLALLIAFWSLLSARMIRRMVFTFEKRRKIES